MAENVFGGQEEKMPAAKKILIISGCIAAVFFVIGILNLIPVDKNHPDKTIVMTPFRQYDYNFDGQMEPENAMNRAMDFFILGIAILIGPYGFYKSMELSRIRGIEERLPEFLRDVAEAGRFGMTLAEAIVVASTGRYGKLTPEIRKMAAQIKWGVPAAEALRLFSVRVNTPAVRRCVAIITKANDAGGNVADVLSMVAHDTKEVQLMDAQKRISMTTYLTVIYIAFFVFIVTIMILNATFLPQMAKAGKSVEEGAQQLGGGGGASATKIEYKLIPEIMFVMFVSVMIHAIGDGILAGVIITGKIATGLQHSFIMVILGWLLMRFMV
ncbi:MAG: type II secretion system F family protein [Thermoplasmata archaeon]|nr:type II secretion system F family protein [Thermoplasmata archaeon]